MVKVSDAGPLQEGRGAPGPAFESLPRRKPRAGRGAVLAWRELWGFAGGGRLACDAAVAGGAQSWRRNRRRRTCSVARMRRPGAGAAVEGALATSCGRRLPAPGRGWRRRETALRGRKRSDDHEVSILIWFGCGDRAGRAPSNVSMMIIRPPQHGHRCAGEGVSVSRSASAGRGLGAASNWRTRSMLWARTVPANRP